jgi:multisubunit Na+/H+ antiporter MnhB subunit
VTLLAVHLALTAAYAGFQWTVRAVVYPQFALVPPADFPAYEHRHQQRISRVVGPLFAGQGVTTLWLLADRPDGTPLVPVVAGAACLAVVLAATALGAVPLHRRLQESWDDAAHRRLLRVDTVRAVAATAGTVAALWVLLG